MILCQRCRGNGVLPIKQDGKRVGVMVCPECRGRGEKHPADGLGDVFTMDEFNQSSRQ